MSHVKQETESTNALSAENYSALFQLGIKYLNSNDFSEAVKCFQKCIRYNSQDYRSWECLAEAYFHRGSLKASINTFQRSVTCEDAKNDGQLEAYARLRCADIKRSIGHFEAALTDYKFILEKHDNVAALIGCAETKIMMAKEAFDQSLFSNGHKFCDEALELSFKAAQLKPNLSTVWQFCADACLTACLFGKTSFKTNIAIISEEDLQKTDFINLAEKFCLRSIYVNKSNGYLWHSLGLVYWLKYLESFDSSRDMWIKKSIHCLLKSLTFNTTNPQFWNALGVIACFSDDLDIAQHALIKSISLSKSSNELQWTNLGAIYFRFASLLNDNQDKSKRILHLAHKAFANAQADEPDLVNCWMGLALIAESVEHEKSETLDLFRHCDVLSNYPMAQIGFANQLFNNISLEGDATLIQQATDSLVRFIRWNNNSYIAYNFLSLLLERCNATYLAHKACEKALSLFFNIDNENAKNAILLNYNRLLTKQHLETIDFSNTAESSQKLLLTLFTLWSTKDYENALNICKTLLECDCGESYSGSFKIFIAMIFHKLSNTKNDPYKYLFER